MAIGMRMKEYYEYPSSVRLTRRIPVILRLDGKCFHTFTSGCDKPFDVELSNAMVSTAYDLVREIQGAKFAYIQSDEISILLTDYDKLETSAWFDYNVQKMCSVASSLCTVKFSEHYIKKNGAMFDARVFNIPKEEVVNYFIWRQLDWMRNSVQMVARSKYSQKQLHGKNNDELKEMIRIKGVNWDFMEDIWKYGGVTYKKFVVVNNNMTSQFPIYDTSWEIESAFKFVENREFFDIYLNENFI